MDDTHLILRKAAANNDTGSNGGHMSASATASAKNANFPDVQQAERTSGSTSYRKRFWHVADPDNGSLTDALIYLDTPSPGDSRVAIFPGTQGNTQADLTGSERLYGAATLNEAVAAGATQIQAVCEDGDDEIFQAGDRIHLVNSSQEEFTTCQSVTWNGDLATLTLESGLLYDYSQGDAVSSCIEAGDLATSWDGWSGSTTSGKYGGSKPPTAPTTHEPSLDNIGTIEETWTVTFSSATAFSCTGARVGNVGSGSTTGGDFSPNNPDFNRPCFTLPVAGWSGTWAVGDVLQFTTHPAAAPVWLKRVIPAGAAVSSGDGDSLRITGSTV